MRRSTLLPGLLLVAGACGSPSGRRPRRRRAGVLLPVVLLLLPAACDPTGIGDGWFGEPRVYVHRLFESTEACLAAQEEWGAWFNCSQVVVFCPDRTGALMLTDIVHRTRYSRLGPYVTVRMAANPEVASALTFVLSSDLRSMARPGSEAVWTLDDAGDSASGWARTCER